MNYHITIEKDKNLHIQNEVLSIAGFAAKNKMNLGDIAFTLELLSHEITRLDDIVKKLHRQKIGAMK